MSDLVCVCNDGVQCLIHDAGQEACLSKLDAGW